MYLSASWALELKVCSSRLGIWGFLFSLFLRQGLRYLGFLHLNLVLLITFTGTLYAGVCEKDSLKLATHFVMGLRS